MHAILVWIDKDTKIPSVIGPYESDLAFDDANLLKSICFKVLVTQITTPEKSEALKLLTKT